MKQLVIYIHGKGGNSEEAEHYKSLFPESDIIGFDYKSQNPWEAKKEFPAFYDLCSKEYNSIILIANSIGAFFALSSLADKQIDKALLISPIVDMERKYPIKWDIQTYILYGEKDNLTSFETISEFANRVDSSLVVMQNGEHWFHTDEQMAFLDNWVRNSVE